MAQGRTFVRVVLEVEVEVVDPVALAAADLMIVPTDDGGLAMLDPIRMPAGGHGEEYWMDVAKALQMALIRGLDGVNNGLTFMGAGGIPRFDNGTEYPELTLPSMPARGPDGEFVEPPDTTD